MGVESSAQRRGLDFPENAQRPTFIDAPLTISPLLPKRSNLSREHPYIRPFRLGTFIHRNRRTGRPATSAHPRCRDPARGEFAGRHPERGRFSRAPRGPVGAGRDDLHDDPLHDLGRAIHFSSAHRHRRSRRVRFALLWSLLHRPALAFASSPRFALRSLRDCFALH